MSKLSQVESLNRLFQAAPNKTHAAKSILIYEDDEVSYLHHINRGFVKVYTITEDGDERVLLILKHGDVFPLIRDPEQPSTRSLYFYETMNEVQVSVINRNDLLEHIKADRDASWAMVRYISELSSDLTNRISSLESKSVEDKIKKLMVYLIGICGKQMSADTWLLDLKLTHLDIANLVGHTRESASVMMTNLKKQGVVSYRNGLLVVKHEAESAI